MKKPLYCDNTAAFSDIGVAGGYVVLIVFLNCVNLQCLYASDHGTAFREDRAV